MRLKTNWLWICALLITLTCSTSWAALTATVQWDVRIGGSDNNGGGFDSAQAGSGTDYSQQASAQVAINNSTITTSVTSNVITFSTGYSPASTDIGNIVHVVSGTLATAKDYQITAVTPGALGTWTVDGNISSGTTTNMVANMGGSKATPGGCMPQNVGGQQIWVKYNATNFLTSSGTNNVATGRVTFSNAGTVTQYNRIRGYDVVHGDQTGNRPTIKWNVTDSLGFLINPSANYVAIENIILDGNRATYSNQGGISLGNNTGITINNVKIKSCSDSALDWSANGTSVTIINCEITDCITAAAVNMVGAAINMEGCSIHDNTVTAIKASVGTLNISRTQFYNNTGGSTFGISFTGAGILHAQAVTMGTVGSNGFDFQVAMTQVSLQNCYVESAGGYGYNFATAMDGVWMYNCGGYNNTPSNYQTANVNTNSVQGFIAITAGSAFNNIGTGDLGLNNTTNQGALLRAVGFPTTFPGTLTANYMDVGSSQHQATAGLPTKRIIH